MLVQQKWMNLCSTVEIPKSEILKDLIQASIYKTCVCLVAQLVQLFLTPQTVALQAPLSMKFSRQEYWSGSPFPSPGNLPNPGIEPGSPALQAEALPSEPPGKPKNIGAGSLSLLQGIFLTQELNWGLLHCRRNLYHWAARAARSVSHSVMSNSLWLHGL